MPDHKAQSDFFAQDLLDRIAENPSLATIFLAQDLSAKVGFDFRNIDLVMERTADEFREMSEAFAQRHEDPEHFREELGDCFFALVNLCRHAGIDPEQVARENAQKYLKRCKFIEEKLAGEGKNWCDLTLEEIYAAWREAKQAGL